jgi:hypothetical protein
LLVKLGDGRSQCSLMCSSLVVQEPFGQAPQSCCLFFILRLPNQWDQVPKIRPHNVVRPVQGGQEDNLIWPKALVIHPQGIRGTDDTSQDELGIAVRVATDPDPVLDAEGRLLSMGVHAASCYEPGSGGPIISLYLDRGEWAWDGTAEAVVAWIDGFMADPTRADNLRQLAAAAQGEAHLAVFADMGVDGTVWRALYDQTGTGVVRPVRGWTLST